MCVQFNTGDEETDKKLNVEGILGSTEHEQTLATVSVSVL